jgi:hypothetical protein
VYSPSELLEKCFADGFTFESISKATDIPVELIVRFHGKGKITPQENNTLNYLGVFLMQLYAVNPDNESYLKDMVWVINNHFDIPSSTIAKYLNLEENDLEIFLNKHEPFNNSFSISRKLIHLFTTLIRDKRHST